MVTVGAQLLEIAWLLVGQLGRFLHLALGSCVLVVLDRVLAAHDRGLAG